MNREDFQKGMADYDLARMSNSLALDEEAMAPASPPEGEPDPLENTQLAAGATHPIPPGIGRKMLKGLLGEERGALYGRNAADLVKNKPDPPNPISIDDVNSTLGKYALDKEGSMEAFPGLDTIDSPDQLTALVEQAGKTTPPSGGRSWAEVQARTSTVAKVMDELRPITEGRQGMALTDVQLHGVSRIVATAYDDVATITAKIKAGTSTPEDIIRLANAKDTYEVMHGYLKGQGSEVGRALNSLKMTGEALKGKDLAAYERMTSGENGTKFTKYITEWSDAVAKRVEKGDSVGKAMGFVNEALRGDWIRIGVEFWKNNQLSGIKTHVTNNVSVAGHLLYENIAVRPLAAGIGAVRRGVLGGEQSIKPDELLAPLYSSYAGLRGYMGLFWDNMAHGKRQFEAADKVEDSLALSNKIKESGAPQVIKQAADWATSASFKLLSASDEANRGIAFTQELYALASRQASKDGLSGKAHITRMNELLDNPPLSMYDKAMTHAAQMTFTDVEQKGWIASTSKALRVMVGEIPPLQFIIPYINTPSNLLRVGMEMSPLAPISKRLRDDLMAGGVKADIAMAKMTAGMGMGVLYWQLYEAGILSGTGPDDYKAQSILKADGWQPLAINIDGKAYGMERMDPFTKAAKFTESLASFVGEMDKAKYAANPADKEAAFGRGMLYMVEAVMEDQWLEQASGFIKVLEGQEQFEKYIARTGAGFVPYHALAKSITEFSQEGRPQLSQDSIVSDISAMMEDQVMGNLPGSDHFVRIKRNWDGTPHMPEQSQFSAGALPWGPTKLKNDPLSTLLFENGVFPEDPSSVITIGPVQFSLLQVDESGRIYDRYIEAVGRERRRLLQIAVDEGDITDAKEAGEEYFGIGMGEGPGSAVTTALNKIMAGGKVAGKGILIESIKQWMDENPIIKTQLNQAMGIDIEAVIEDAVMDDNDLGLEGPVRHKPTRDPLEYPIPEMGR